MAKFAQIWKPKEHKYEPYKLPEGSVIIAENPDMEISCCKCGKHIKYGDSYCSREVHNDFGFGYSECAECYDKAIVERLTNDKD